MVATVAPEAKVRLPPVTIDTLSTKLLAPPTVRLPALLLPKMMLLKPSLNTEVPLNKLLAKLSVPAPEPMPMVVPLVSGSIVKEPVPATTPVPVQLKLLDFKRILPDVVTVPSDLRPT